MNSSNPLFRFGGYLYPFFPTLVDIRTPLVEFLGEKKRERMSQPDAKPLLPLETKQAIPSTRTDATPPAADKTTKRKLETRTSPRRKKKKQPEGADAIAEAFLHKTYKTLTTTAKQMKSTAQKLDEDAEEDSIEEVMDEALGSVDDFIEKLQTLQSRIHGAISALERTGSKRRKHSRRSSSSESEYEPTESESN